VAGLLLANNADNPKNNDGDTPLHYAVMGSHNDIAELVPQHGGQEEEPARLTGITKGKFCGTSLTR
jgi:ankyrin repeat protein